MLGLFVMVAPYIGMKALTNFDNGQSTGSQRAWIMVWLVAGQVLGPYFFLMYDIAANDSLVGPVCLVFMTICYLLVFSVGSVGGFVTVARMMLGDKVCVTL